MSSQLAARSRQSALKFTHNDSIFCDVLEIIANIIMNMNIREERENKNKKWKKYFRQISESNHHRAAIESLPLPALIAHIWVKVSNFFSFKHKIIWLHWRRRLASKRERERHTLEWNFKWIKKMLLNCTQQKNKKPKIGIVMTSLSDSRAFGFRRSLVKFFSERAEQQARYVEHISFAWRSHGRNQFQFRKRQSFRFLHLIADIVVGWVNVSSRVDCWIARWRYNLIRIFIWFYNSLVLRCQAEYRTEMEARYDQTTMIGRRRENNEFNQIIWQFKHISIFNRFSVSLLLLFLELEIYAENRVKTPTDERAAVSVCLFVSLTSDWLGWMLDGWNQIPTVEQSSMGTRHRHINYLTSNNRQITQWNLWRITKWKEISFYSLSQMLAHDNFKLYKSSV